jgi:GNAT superfamily N-acetyltransferase
MLLSCGLRSNGAWRHYYYHEGGHLAGILSALRTDQIVSFETVGVLKHHRNQGIGSNLLRYALWDASRAGYQVASAYPIDHLQGFFSKNAFEKFGTVDCISIGAAQLRDKRLHVDHNAIATPMTPAMDSGESNRAKI